VAINRPFKGGYTIRHHASEMPWMRLEFSRTLDASAQQKGKSLLKALKNWIFKLEQYSD
jgi:hypothetical protein